MKFRWNLAARRDVGDREARNHEQIDVGEQPRELGLHIREPAILDRAFVLVGRRELRVDGLAFLLGLGNLLLGQHLLRVELGDQFLLEIGLGFVVELVAPLAVDGDDFEPRAVLRGFEQRLIEANPRFDGPGADLAEGVLDVGEAGHFPADDADLEPGQFEFAFDLFDLAFLAGVGRGGGRAAAPFLEHDVGHVEAVIGERLLETGVGEIVDALGAKVAVDDADRNLGPAFLHRENAAREHLDALRE